MNTSILLLTGCLLTVVKGQGELTSDSFLLVSHLTDKVCPDILKIFISTVRTVSQCAILSLSTGTVCGGYGFNNDTKTCYGCKRFNTIYNCSSPHQYVSVIGTNNYMKKGHLVSGVFPILDVSLSESSSYGPVFTAAHARLCKLQTGDGNGAFVSASNNVNEWVQGYIRVTESINFYHRNVNLLEKYNSNLKTLLRQGVAHPEFYGDVVYRLRKIVGHSQFSSLFVKIIKSFKKSNYNPTIL